MYSLRTAAYVASNCSLRTTYELQPTNCRLQTVAYELEPTNCHLLLSHVVLRTVAYEGVTVSGGEPT